MGKVYFGDNHVESRITDRERRIADRLSKKLDAALTETGRETLAAELGRPVEDTYLDLGDQPGMFVSGTKFSFSIDSDKYGRVDVDRYPDSHKRILTLNPDTDFDAKKLKRARSYAYRKTHSPDHSALLFALARPVWAAGLLFSSIGSGSKKNK